MATSIIQLDPNGTEAYEEVEASMCRLPTDNHDRYVAFMNAVERLSRNCNVWISSGRAMHLWPVISDAFGEEAGYRVAQGAEGATMDLMLRSDMVRGPNHLLQQHERFIAELTVLSRRHSLWIRAGVPTTWPRLISLAQPNFEPAHYAIRQTDNGGGFLVDISYTREHAR